MLGGQYSCKELKVSQKIHFLGSKLQLCQLEIPIFIYKLKYKISLINSFLFVFCEFNCLASWNEATLSFWYDHYLNFKIEIQFSYSRSTYVNVNMSFPNSNFEGNFSTFVLGKSFWHYRYVKVDCWTSRYILCEKNIKFLYVCGD